MGIIIIPPVSIYRAPFSSRSIMKINCPGLTTRCLELSRPILGCTVPRTIRNGKTVFTIGRNSKVTCLVPLIIPVIGGSARIHSAEDDIRIFFVSRNCYLIISISIRIFHVNPFIAISKEISCKTRISLRPVGTWLKIKRFGLSRTRGDCHYCKAGENCHQNQESDQNFACVLHSFVLSALSDIKNLYKYL